MEGGYLGTEAGVDRPIVLWYSRQDTYSTFGGTQMAVKSKPADSKTPLFNLKMPDMSWLNVFAKNQTPVVVEHPKTAPSAYKSPTKKVKVTLKPSKKLRASQKKAKRLNTTKRRSH